MKIAVWCTGHEIADTVADAVYEGLRASGQHACAVINANDGSNYLGRGSDNIIKVYDIHIGYGILRGMDNIFRACGKLGKPWFNIDRGYWKPGHYDGYYRVSLRGTQQTINLDKLQPGYDRLDQLKIDILEPKDRQHLSTMLCPPTDYACQFFGIDLIEWEKKNTPKDEYFIRNKEDPNDLQNHLDGCSKVITFNSAVGWEALRQGIKVVSDPIHSIVGFYEKLIDKPLHLDYEARRRLLAIQSGLQLNLEEIRLGKLWPIMSRLLSTSGTTAEKP